MADIFYEDDTEKSDDKEKDFESDADNSSNKNGGNKMLTYICILLLAAAVIVIVVYLRTESKPSVIPYDERTHAPASVSNNDGYVFFGSYPQTEVAGEMLTSEITSASYDKDGAASVNGVNYYREKDSNGNYRYFVCEPIKWKILADNGDYYLLISDMIIDAHYYEKNQNAGVTWIDSNIYEWLQTDFLSRAFTEEEINSLICMQNVGDVFLLNKNELDSYILVKGEFSFEDVKVYGTDYARFNGLTVGEYDGDASWYLRNDSENNYAIVTGSSDGLAYMESCPYGTLEVDGVRPAIIIYY